MCKKTAENADNYMTFKYRGKRQGALVKDNSLLRQTKEFIALQQGIMSTTSAACAIQSEIANTPTTKVEGTKEKSKIERLNELTDLYNQGALDEEEFKQLKNEIINRGSQDEYL